MLLKWLDAIVDDDKVDSSEGAPGRSSIPLPGGGASHHYQEKEPDSRKCHATARRKSPIAGSATLLPGERAP